MSAPENPPAFPSRHDTPMPGGGKYRNDVPGMSLRDWFAGQALAGQLSDPANERACQNIAARFGVSTAGAMARCCYDYADAMLAARARADDA